jgi:hypothetical protein
VLAEWVGGHAKKVRVWELLRWGETTQYGFWGRLSSFLLDGFSFFGTLRHGAVQPPQDKVEEKKPK